MPKTLAEVISSFAAKGKVDLKDERFANALSAPDLTTLTIPDELYEALDNSLLSIDAAKGNHPDIKPHYTAMAYDGLDKELNALMDSEKLPEDIRKEILAERSSTKRVGIFARKIKELESKKANSGKGEKEALAQEIRELQDALRLEKEGINKVKEEYEGKLREKDMSYAMRNLMASYNNTIHEHLDPEIKSNILNSLIGSALKKDNASLSLDDNGNLILVKADGNPVYSSNHQPLTPKSYVDKLLADTKQLKINDQPATPPVGATQRYQPTPGQTTVQQGKTANFTAQQRNLQALADVERAAQQGAML